MTLHRRGSAKRLHAARRAWLAERPELIVGVPGINEDVSDEGRARLDAVRERLRSADLLGASQVEVQRDTIRRLVSELRGEHVGIGVGW